MVKNRSRRSRLRLFLAVLVAALLGATWLAYGEGLRRTAGAGVAYGARVACACRYIGGRTLEDCAKDKLDGMELVRFSEDRETRSVTAAIPLVASDTATYRKGYGCVLEPWES